jgi:hypothetical protein
MHEPERNDFFRGAIVACSLGLIVWLLMIGSLWLLGVL